MGMLGEGCDHVGGRIMNKQNFAPVNEAPNPCS